MSQEHPGKAPHLKEIRFTVFAIQTFHIISFQNYSNALY